MKSRVGEVVAGLPPGAFAFVMATGILSVGLSQQGLGAVSQVFLALAVAAWLILVVLTAGRLLRYRDRAVADLRDPRRAFGFFTLVAGTNVLAVRLASDSRFAAMLLLGFGVVAGLVLAYTVPWTAVLSRTERPVLTEANGTWFIWVVAIQSVAAAAAGLEPLVETGRNGLSVVAVAAWSVGVMLYLACVMFVSLRLLLYPLRPRDLDPPYWVAMGAAAITVVAGAKIVEMASTPMVDATAGLVSGLAVVFWAWATWLIPVLIAVEVWRHVVHHIPVRYETTWWSVVFPLSMYAVAGMYLGLASSLPIVERIGAGWLWVAVLAWCFAAAMMVRSWIGRGNRAD
ncbi:tellurite resistance/C4-dicarboxylate transporter family protein [Dietzia lutea]|uniref:tellurite resistance/C4-dicarboxylate transporter family protein n=1 Tax=Dietzia lutea TaxID=546160 RepID=UPI001FC9896F|nr:tellurite resistance/C4-dicarboxylate transporter family protein [Dietzia lutea]